MNDKKYVWQSYLAIGLTEIKIHLIEISLTDYNSRTVLHKSYLFL